jgi:hypothetical protein
VNHGFWNNFFCFNEPKFTKKASTFKYDIATVQVQVLVVQKPTKNKLNQQKIDCKMYKILKHGGKILDGATKNLFLFDFSAVLNFWEKNSPKEFLVVFRWNKFYFIAILNSVAILNFRVWLHFLNFFFMSIYRQYL